MSYVQVRSPNLSLKEYAGYCHRLIRRVYGAPAVEPSAWQAWLRAKGRHTGAHPKNVSVPIWFSHYGTYGGVYKNWGHVVAYVPGRGYMSSPLSGYGVLWFKTIAAVERAFNAKYVGWSTDISTVTVVKYSPTPSPSTASSLGDEDMIYIRRNSQSKVYAYDPLTKRKRAIGTGEWEAIKAAFAAAGRKLPIMNTADIRKRTKRTSAAALNRHFGI